jgi:hypothetical protein
MLEIAVQITSWFLAENCFVSRTKKTQIVFTNQFQHPQAYVVFNNTRNNRMNVNMVILSILVAFLLLLASVHEVLWVLQPQLQVYHQHLFPNYLRIASLDLYIDECTTPIDTPFCKSTHEGGSCLDLYANIANDIYGNFGETMGLGAGNTGLRVIILGFSCSKCPAGAVTPIVSTLSTNGEKISAVLGKKKMQNQLAHHLVL